MNTHFANKQLLLLFQVLFLFFGILNPTQLIHASSNTHYKFPNETAARIAARYPDMRCPTYPSDTLYKNLAESKGHNHAINIAKNKYNLDVRFLEQEQTTAPQAPVTTRYTNPAYVTQPTPQYIFKNELALRIAQNFRDMNNMNHLGHTLYGDLTSAINDQDAREIAREYNLDISSFFQAPVTTQYTTYAQPVYNFQCEAALRIAQNFTNINNPTIPGQTLYSNLANATEDKYAIAIAKNIYGLNVDYLFQPVTTTRYTNPVYNPTVTPTNTPAPWNTVTPTNTPAPWNTMGAPTNVQAPWNTATTTTTTQPVKNEYNNQSSTQVPEIIQAMNVPLIGPKRDIKPTITPTQIQFIAAQETTKSPSTLTTGQWGQQNKKQGTIYFYDAHQSWGLFANTFAAPVTIDGVRYPTVEHFFQGIKYQDQQSHKADVLNQPTGGAAARAGGVRSRKTMTPKMHSFYYHNNDAGANVIMWYGIAHRIEQDANFAAALLATGDAILVENAGANDANWGAGADGNGKNKLGIMLMEMRALLQAGQLTTHIPADVLAKLP